MRAATFVPILVLALSSIACESEEDEFDELRFADHCGPSMPSDSNSDSTESIPLTCVMAIPTPPEGEIFDPSRVNITIEIDGVRMTIPRVEGEGDCGSRDGWYYSPNNLAPEAIVLCPSTCESVQKAEKGSVDVVLGCVTEHG